MAKTVMREICQGSAHPRVPEQVSQSELGCFQAESESREGFEEDLGRLGQLMELQGRRVR